MSLISLDGSSREGGGQVLRTALALSAATGRAFEMTRIHARRPVTGLQPDQVAAIRAAALVCSAKVGGAYDGSPELRFEPGPVTPGEFRFEIASAGAATLVLQTVLLPLATADGASRVEVTGGTHVSVSPSFHYLSRHWREMVGRLGLELRLELLRAGFYPAGGGEIRAEVQPWRRPASLSLEDRGPLVAVRGLSGTGRIKTDVAARQAEAARSRLWDVRRIESAWEVVEVPTASPGAFLLLEALFERGRAAFDFLGKRGGRPEQLGDRAGRTLLQFLDDEGATDEHMADQIAVPLAVAKGGGRVTTNRVTPHLETTAGVLRAFGVGARTWGRLGGPGGYEVDAC